MLCTGCAKTEIPEDADVTEALPVQMEAPAEPETTIADSSLAVIDSTRWNYNAEDAVYWQVQIPYCGNPVDLQYETWTTIMKATDLPM